MNEKKTFPIINVIFSPCLVILKTQLNDVKIDKQITNTINWNDNGILSLMNLFWNLLMSVDIFGLFFFLSIFWYSTYLVNALISGINPFDEERKEKKPIKRIIDMLYVALNQRNTIFSCGQKKPQTILVFTVFSAKQPSTKKN